MNMLRSVRNLLTRKLASSAAMPSMKQFGTYNKPFKSTGSGDPNRNHKGFFQGKRETWGNSSTRRRFKLNVKRKMVFSHILHRKFYPWLSSKAIRTMRKYGSFDRFVLHFKYKFLRESKWMMFIRKLLKEKLENPLMRVPRNRQLPMGFIGKERPRRRTHQLKGMSSIYIPVETRKTDISEIYTFEDHEPRWEIERKDKLIKELEHVIDAKRRNEILSQLGLDEEDKKLKSEMLALMPARHKCIRDMILKVKDKPIPKKQLLEKLDDSETFAKGILGKDYKHYSVDYPEIQLILQKFDGEQKKTSQRAETILYKQDSPFNMGTAYEGKHHKLIFNPYPKTAGETIRMKTHKKDLMKEEQKKYSEWSRTERGISLNKSKAAKKKNKNVSKRKAQTKVSDLTEKKVIFKV